MGRSRPRVAVGLAIVIAMVLTVVGGMAIKAPSSPLSGLRPNVGALVTAARFDGSVADLADEEADADAQGSATAGGDKPTGEGDGAELAGEENVPGFDLPPSGPDTALQSQVQAALDAPAPAPNVSFDGMKKEGPAPNGGGWPPDTNGDVGPNHYIQTVNTKIGIYTKAGVQLSMVSFNTLFDGTGTACDAANQGDPVVVYDPMGDRWIISDFAWSNITTGPFYECFAVSKTGDPVNGGWYFYAVQADSGAHIPDYPKIGVWTDAIYMSANVFNSTVPQTFVTARVWALNRSDMENGLPLRSVSFDVGSPGGVQAFSLLPANLRGMAPPAARPGMFVSIWGTYAARVWKLQPDWTTLANSTLSGPTDVPVTSFAVGPAQVPQLSGNAIDTLSYRLMMQAQYRNIGGTESLWISHTVGNGSGTASIRWYQLNVTGGTVQTSGPVQQGTYNPDSNHRFAPSLGTTGWQMLVWGFFVSTTALFHGTACINSMAHLMGKRRFKTDDDSRNSFILAIICLGEGWHNNHHRFQSCTRNGFYWWEIDPTYYGLKLLSYTGLIWGLKPVPKSILEEGMHADHHHSIEAAARSAELNAGSSSLRAMLPTAAAIAVATATAAQADLPKKADGPAIHKDLSGEMVKANPPATTSGQNTII